mgnify:CR=1 FL=1
MFSFRAHKVSISPYCHVEPVETSSRKAHILLILFATLDPSTSLRMTGWGHPHPIGYNQKQNLSAQYFKITFCISNIHIYIFSQDSSTKSTIYIERVRVRVQLCACTRAIVCVYMRVYMRVYILCVHARARVYKNTLVKAGGAGRI